MSKTFLNKKQIKYLKESGWEIPPTEEGVIWFGQDWDGKTNPLVSISNEHPDLLDASDESITGYDLLVIGVRPNKGGE